MEVVDRANAIILSYSGSALHGDKLGDVMTLARNEVRTPGSLAPPNILMGMSELNGLY